MVIQRLTKTNPYVFSAFILCILIYSGFIRIKSKYTMNSLFQTEKITYLKGAINTNPVMSSSEKYFYCDFSVSEAGNEFFFGKAKGIIKILIPASAGNAYLPGKIYTMAKEDAVICEIGSNILVNGSFISKDTFLCRTTKQLPNENNLLGKIKSLRAKSRLHFRRLMFSWGAAGGLMLALLSGIREYSDLSLQNAFRKAGLSHILALSGMHLNLFSSLTKSLPFAKISIKLQYIVQFITVNIFVWFAGTSPSLFRALLCSEIMLVISLFNLKKIKMIEILCLSFIIHCLIRPHDCKELAFILSYGSLAGILLFSEIAELFVSRSIPKNISASLAASAGAQFVTCPIGLKTIGTFAPIGIISTVIVSPLITLFIYAGLFFIILSMLFPFFSCWGAFFLKIIYTLIEKSVFLFSQTPCIQ